jgi:hypothetical protein
MSQMRFSQLYEMPIKMYSSGHEPAQDSQPKMENQLSSESVLQYFNGRFC